MKIRRGFVSNSSSSSFICNVCGEAESGMDASLSDFDMSECEEGHYFCNHHAPNLSQHEKYVEFNEYEVPKELCPICTLLAVPDEVLVKFLLITLRNTKKEDYIKSLRTRFESLQQLEETYKELNDEST